MAIVVIADDEQNLLELLKMVLEGLEHQVLTASNGKEALQLVKSHRPALVISDVMMPIMDGYELLEQIRLKVEWANIKVVLISAASLKRSLLYKADAYLAKPYDIAVIEAVVSRLLG